MKSFLIVLYVLGGASFVWFTLLCNNVLEFSTGKSFEYDVGTNITLGYVPSILSSIMTLQWIRLSLHFVTWVTKTEATNEVEILDPSGASKFTHGFNGIPVFYVVLFVFFSPFGQCKLIVRPLIYSFWLRHW